VPYKDPDKQRAQNRVSSALYRARNPEKRKELAAKVFAKQETKDYRNLWRRENVHKARQRDWVKRGVILSTVRPKDPDERCGICGVREDRSTPLVLDHNHQTGEFRGWLCQPCNCAIGLLCDDPVNLQSAIEYLER